MLWRNLKNPLVVVVGPTCVGKTEISIQLAEQVGGEIISADSRLFYRGMDIGTAKPSLEEQKRVRHHLIDVAAPDDPWSLSIFQKEVKKTIEEIRQRGKLPFLVGGTGQYVHAIIEEWEIPTLAPDTRLREALEAWGRAIGPLALHEKLAFIDPAAALKIEPHNLRRTVRALEVICHTGKMFSDQRRKGESPYHVCQIGLIRPRNLLYQRIDERIDKMISDGLLDEVRRLLDAGYPSDLPTFSAIGYREMVQVIQGSMTLEEASVLMKRATHQFVRRQANWFKESDPSIHWFDLTQTTFKTIAAFIDSELAWKQSADQ